MRIIAILHDFLPHPSFSILKHLCSIFIFVYRLGCELVVIGQMRRSPSSFVILDNRIPFSPAPIRLLVEGVLVCQNFIVHSTHQIMAEFTRADRIFGRSNIWPLRRSVHTGPANRPQIRSPRRANIRPLRKATFFGTWPVKFANSPVWTALAGRMFARYHKEGFNMWQRGL